MTFAREKRLWLGAAAFVVAWPLPLNDALEWPVLALFVVGVAAILRRAWRGAERWLSDRALNLLGLAYLPVLVVDVAWIGRAQMVRPVLHLILFGLLAKLASLGRERDKWQAWIGIFFLFLAAMATSVHPSVLLYLVLFLGLTVAILARFVYLHILSSFGHGDSAARGLPLGRFVLAASLATLVFAAPLFALLPRVRSPYILAVGPGGGAGNPAAGFSDEMSLDLIGRIRDNPQVALRVELAGRHPKPDLLRLKAATYERWEGRTWRRSPGARTLRRDPLQGSYALAPGPAAGTARITLEPLRITSLPVPVEANAVEVDAPMLELDRGGALLLKGMPAEALEYVARLGREPASLGLAPAEAGDGALDRAGVTPRMAELATRWAGEGDAAARAAAIELRLLEDYEYSLESLGRGGVSPLETFLFETRRGHCEYFASSMVLLLRAEGIPARLITGFYGAEQSWWDRAWIVRQSNAHAWVEAYLPERGWTTFDPTPPAGRPVASSRNAWLYARQAYEALVFRWDRYVLSYDFYDQVSFAGGLREMWARWMRSWRGRDDGPRAEAPRVPEAPGQAAPPAGGAPPGWLLSSAVVFALGAALLGLWLWRRRVEWSSAAGYRELRAVLAGAGLPVAPAMAPLALADLVRRRLPAAAEPAARMVAIYLDESFGGRALDPSARLGFRADLSAVEAALRARRRRRGPGSVPYFPPLSRT